MNIPGFGRLISTHRESPCFSCGNLTKKLYNNPTSGTQTPCCDRCYNRIYLGVVGERRRNITHRWVKWALLAICIVALLILAFCKASAQTNKKGREIKIYLDAPTEEGLNETVVPHLSVWLTNIDEEDDSFWLNWVEPKKATYIISLMTSKNALPVMVRERPNVYTACTQYMVVTHLWMRGSGKTHEMSNAQLNCDVDAIGEMAAKAIFAGIGLRITGEAR